MPGWQVRGQLLDLLRGSFTGARSFDTATDTPGVKDTVTLSFTPTGTIHVGGSIEIVMPTLAGVQSQWSFETPSAPWTTPSTSAAAAQSTTWNAGTKTLTIAVATNDSVMGVAQVIEITNARTPPSIVDANTVSVSSKDSQGTVIDGPTLVATDATTTTITHICERRTTRLLKGRSATIITHPDIGPRRPTRLLKGRSATITTITHT